MAAWVVPAVQAGIAILGGLFGSSSNKKAGRAARDAAIANAADILHYAGLNADIMLGAAERNVQAILNIGEANAVAVERAAKRNMFLYGVQAVEEARRHVIGEVMTAGKIRAVWGGSGIQVNTGTPLAYLNSQIDEGITQRRFMIFKHRQTLLSMKEESEDRAAVLRLTASENAAVTWENAQASADVSLNDAARAAAATERGGAAMQSQYNAQASSALWGGLTSAVGYGFSAYSGWNASRPPTQLSAPPIAEYSTSNGVPAGSPYAQYSSQQLPSWYG